ncbi:glycoside hydrolase family 15 protein [Kribbella jiaozuonensis]|uniref:glycoside hydrolase family 15 protein n=1 Tax=Kribbella jiaozuonensis TaxID=2575441 RepID=UPI00192DD416|nr:glycoside hydrolase family 15 protein [Kribbella jiaozuonensis]
MRRIGHRDNRLIPAEDPQRFAGLAMQMTATMNEAYPCAILWGFGEATIPADARPAAFDAIRHIMSLGLSSCDRRLGWSVRRIHDDTPLDVVDGMSGAEGTFTICSFWLVSALVEIGDLGEATALCEKLLSYASPLGLYAEEIDPLTGRQLGNFPHGFTHLAMINAITHIIRAEEAAGTFIPPRQRFWGHAAWFT